MTKIRQKLKKRLVQLDFHFSADSGYGTQKSDFWVPIPPLKIIYRENFVIYFFKSNKLEQGLSKATKNVAFNIYAQKIK